MNPLWPRVAAWWPGTTTTRRMLLSLRGALLAGTAIALACCLWVLLGVRESAQAVSQRTAPAILDIDQTQVALLEAHAAAMSSLAREEVLLGVGDEYRAQITAAEQTLTRVAENNAAGDRGSTEIQVLTTLLNSYRGLVERASVYLQRGGEIDALVVASVQDAASVLAEMRLRLDRLRGYQTEVLDGQVGAGWTAPAAFLVWLIPVLLLGALLVWTQVILSRRFRRTLNAPLLAATALTALLAGGTTLSLLSAGELGDARDTVRQVGAERQARARQLDSANKRTLDDLRGDRTERAATAQTDPPAAGTAARAAAAIEGAERAADSDRIEFVLPVTSLGIAALILWGLQARIEEYTYRRRGS